MNSSAMEAEVTAAGGSITDITDLRFFRDRSQTAVKLDNFSAVVNAFLDSLKVTEEDTPGMTVQVAPGQGSYGTVALDFAGGSSFSDVAIGNMTIGGGAVADDVADWDKRFRIAPVTFGKSYQPKLQSSGFFSWKSYAIRFKPLPVSTITLT